MVLLLLALLLPANAAEDPLQTARDAAAAYTAGRFDEAATLYAKLADLLPRSPGARTGAARALARTGAARTALDHLSAVVDFGVRFDAADPAFEALRTDPRFRRLESRMRQRTAPIVRSSVAFRLDPALIPENIAHDPKTGAWFVGSMYKAKIVRIGPDGSVRDFIPPQRHGLLSVVGMKVDAPRRALWAASGNFALRPPIENEDPATRGKSHLFHFHADTGALVRAYPAPAGSPGNPVLFNDLVVTPGGDVYVTSGPGGIWLLRAGADGLEEFFARPGSIFNGIAITPDGKSVFAASHLEGILRIDLATKKVSPLVLPPGVALGGIDGLYVHGKSLIGVQNGTDPVRVVRAWLDPAMTRVTRFSVLEQEHPESDLPLTGTIVGEHLYYVGRSQLRAFEGSSLWPADRLRETTILKLPLEVDGAAGARRNSMR
jgi:hypothetical protein